MHKYYILYFLLLLSVTINAQETFFATGLEIDEETCSTIPQVPSLVTRDYVVLPVSHSLQQYCPTPRSQREFGTCTSWAVGYAARTIAEAVRNNWTDKELIDKEAFSPLFVYAQIKHTDDHECQRGTDPGAAMSIMKKKGIPKLSSFDVFCAEYISKDLF